MAKIKILIVEDHRLVREGIVTMLSTFPNLEVVGEASDGEEAIVQTKQLQPDIILMDIILPGLSGIEVARILKEQEIESSILFLSMEVSKANLDEIIKLGAKGYVLKDIRKDELAEAIQTVNEGKQYFSKGISDMVFRQYVKVNTSDPQSVSAEIHPSNLTERETEVLKLLCGGFHKRDIADKLFISPRTVDAHRSHILEKLKLSSTVELVKYAIKNNIIDL